MKKDDAVVIPKESEDGASTSKEVTKSKKEDVNIVFMGHANTGKRTIIGEIMVLTDIVDRGALEKYKQKAKRESKQDRETGKTITVGREFFETEKKHFTILDTPGHKSFVPNVIGGAAKIDLAVLIVSALKGEFEIGLDSNGQTREHAMLAKTAGVEHLAVMVNKMDDPTVNWDEARYNECRDKILPHLKKLGFDPAKNLVFLPCSGITGQGLKDQIDEEVCPWYRGPAFIPFIDNLPSFNNKIDGPFIMPIAKHDEGIETVVMGEVGSGECQKGSNLMIMPNKIPVIVDQLLLDDYEVSQIKLVSNKSKNVKIKLKAVQRIDVRPGFVLCDVANPIHTGKIFDAQVLILEHAPIISTGYIANMYIHCAVEEVTIKALLRVIDKKTGAASRTRPRFVKQDQIVIMTIECTETICLEVFRLLPVMGRFQLRDQSSKTIAIGTVLKILE